MAPARAAAYIGGTTLLVAWLASAASVARQPATPAARPPGGVVQIDAVAADVQSQAARLRTRLRAAPALQAPVRNPFAFGAAAVPTRRPAAARVAAAVVHHEDAVPEPPR